MNWRIRPVFRWWTKKKTDEDKSTQTASTCEQRKFFPKRFPEYRTAAVMRQITRASVQLRFSDQASNQVGGHLIFPFFFFLIFNPRELYILSSWREVRYFLADSACFIVEEEEQDVLRFSASQMEHEGTSFFCVILYISPAHHQPGRSSLASAHNKPIRPWRLGWKLMKNDRR